MSFVRSKIIDGHVYYYRVHSVREGKTVRQVHEEYIGKDPGGEKVPNQAELEQSKSQETVKSTRETDEFYYYNFPKDRFYLIRALDDPAGGYHLFPRRDGMLPEGFVSKEAAMKEWGKSITSGDVKLVTGPEASKYPVPKRSGEGSAREAKSQEEGIRESLELLAGRGALGSQNIGVSGKGQPKETLNNWEKALKPHVGSIVYLTGGGGAGIGEAKLLKVWQQKGERFPTGDINKPKNIGPMELRARLEMKSSYGGQKGKIFEPIIDSWQISALKPEKFMRKAAKKEGKVSQPVKEHVWLGRRVFHKKSNLPMHGSLTPGSVSRYTGKDIHELVSCPRCKGIVHGEAIRTGGTYEGSRGRYWDEACLRRDMEGRIKENIRKQGRGAEYSAIARSYTLSDKDWEDQMKYKSYDIVNVIPPKQKD